MSSLDDAARSLGSYQLVSQLAVGGMAEIYVARTRGLGGFEKLVALKLLHRNYSSDPDFVQMLVDEAKLAVQLTHANIVQTFDLGRVDDQYYIAMELIDGVDLYKLLRRASERPVDFPFEVAAFICAEVCAGLDYAHRKRDSKGRPLSIVHRDVSPQNVLVGFDGGVKLVDFGIAKAAMRSQQTAAGVIKGKYYYMSPEQAWGDPIDARTDIFSAGILLYEMLVGQMLYLEQDFEKLLDAVRKANIAPPSRLRRGIPGPLEDIVMRALRKHPDERWQSAGELAQALTEFLHGWAPDFNRARVASFMREVMGDDPVTQARDAGSSTAPGGVVDAPVRDENSLLFKLPALKPEADDEAGDRRATPAPAPRRADIATNVRAGPPGGGDYDEVDETVVDDRHPGRPSVSSMPSGQFDLGPDDPARDPASSTRVGGGVPVGIDEDMPTSARRLPSVELDLDILSDEPAEHAPSPPSLPPLPGVRDARPTVPQARPRPTAARMPSPPPLPATFADEDAAAPTKAARTRPNASASSSSPGQPVPSALLSGQETRPMPKAAPRSSFEEITRIPAPLPPPVESGRWEPGDLGQLAANAAASSGAAADDAGAGLQRGRTRMWYVAAALIAAALGVLLVMTWLTVGGAAGRGTLSIVSLPAGAEVRVDGTGVSTVTPLTLGDVDRRQSHHVRVSKVGYDIWESDVKFPADEIEVRVQAVLVPTVGSLQITSTPAGAEVIVNGRVRGMTPTTVGDLPPNEDVLIELRLRGYKAAARTVTFAGKRSLVVSIPLEKAK